MTDRLKDKVAIITGGGSGIGAAIAKRFAAEGARVVICGRRLEPLQEVVTEITLAGGTAEAFSVDVSDEHAVNGLISNTVESYGQLNILVNNAVSIAPGMLAEQSTESWRQNFTVTVDGTMFMMRAAYPHLKHSQGSVVNISSICGQLATPCMAAYSSAKSALTTLTRNAAVEWAPHNIRVNAVVPGAILTPPTQAVMPTEDAQKAGSALIPLKRIGDPVEVANAILFLASDEASYITGVALNVDGGRAVELVTGDASWED
ncbi:SDR family oxidoreductase [Pseudomaricurvus alkylphenolicus]|jgi:NAD(P)-dependent dehydrogenase (short-subunit alcohol dehydrogenase family)|uniref:SDR family NAD(P)-dependent oxidoreductase n=1 Tax=Pseudomaricurvus alkylphenolicus TaxID=1306991 RepID=UPI0014213CA9|nr:SDR family oxidoreductase [Pseudomaricurvus alkylphenolicus]NIB38003.1 SDR family oxidoreductase [Pseudomaricurvus alkylphenolicus]